ncbi:MAG: hypothetical protein WAZ60_23940 [Desulfosalsimonadaceae bacterium]
MNPFPWNSLSRLLSKAHTWTGIQTFTNAVINAGSAAFTALNATTIGATTPAATNETVPEVDGHAAGALTALQCSNTTVHNIGQGANDINRTLPTEAAGLAFVAQVGEPSANYWRFTAATAGSMTVDGTLAKDYAQFSTPGKDNYAVFRCVKSVPEPSGILTSAALAIGGTKTNVASGAFTFYISGVKYAKAAVAAGTALAAGTIPQNKWGIYRYSIIADGTITSTAAAANFTTGYDTEAAAISAIAALPASSANMGYGTVMSTAVGGFVGGTSNLDDAGVTDNYYSQAVYTATYHWCVTTGSGPSLATN